MYSKVDPVIKVIQAWKVRREAAQALSNMAGWEWPATKAAHAACGTRECEWLLKGRRCCSHKDSDSRLRGGTCCGLAGELQNAGCHVR
jgi:hypothetical protein